MRGIFIHAEQKAKYEQSSSISLDKRMSLLAFPGFRLD
jgi:hypothetical protein